MTGYDYDYDYNYHYDYGQSRRHGHDGSDWQVHINMASLNYPLRWEGDALSGDLFLLDQTKLPGCKEEIHVTTSQQMWDCIKMLCVRGAPAIGIAAAFGVVLGARLANQSNRENFIEHTQQVIDHLKTSRPTAVNLFWALQRQEQILKNAPENPADILQNLFEEAQRILEEDRNLCRAIGSAGAEWVKSGANILTYCNAGGIATSGYGTALSVVWSAAQQKPVHVYACETRPLWQGARLTTWELQQMEIPVTLICDNTAGFIMQQGKVDIIIVGADRIACNGDTANKIGTYSIAALAKVHNIPFYIAAPFSTFDPAIASGKEIAIEERAREEITSPQGVTIAPENVPVYAPAFDVTPGELIHGIITEHGTLKPPYSSSIAQFLEKTHHVN